MTGNEIVLTLDVDWAPDFMIDAAMQILIDHNVRATWFITHESPAVERLKQNADLFEVGIHPNFLPGSSHGDSVESVLRHCLAMAPQATSVRTHALFQSTPLMNYILQQTHIQTDASLFLPHTPFLRPLDYRVGGRTLVRVPFYWADDFEMERAEPCWHLDQIEKVDGLKVFDFHPVHTYLNSRSLESYVLLKRGTMKLNELRQAVSDDLVNTGDGARTLFVEIVQHLSNSRESFRICDMDKQHRAA